MARNKYKKRYQEELNNPDKSKENASVEEADNQGTSEDESVNFDKGIIKTVLLAVIACTLVYKGFFSGGNVTANENTITTIDQPESNTVTALTTNPNPIQPDAISAKDISENRDAANTPPSNAPSTTVKFDELDHNFGTIKQHTTNDYVFKFTNTGNNPLIINSALGSCGCTVPKYPKEPVAPGESAEIAVTYKPGTQIGSQKKSITVTANTEPATTYLVIAAEVEEAPAPDKAGE